LWARSDGYECEQALALKIFPSGADVAPTKEDNMYRLLLTGTAAMAILTTASVIPNCAAAIPLGGLADIPLALEQINPIEKVALCFYFDGWNGPGLYECGYRRRYGEGFVRREREERRERFEDRRERRERFEDRRERRERFEDRRY
jgi:hypothetical protein